MRRRSGEGCHGGHTRELYLRCETAPLLVPERAKQRTYSSPCLIFSTSLISSQLVKMFEDTYAPPVYLDLYNFGDGPQDDIFLDSYAFIPTPSPNQDEVPTPVDQPVSQPSPTDTADQSSAARTAREPGLLDYSFKALFFIVALYTGDVF